jgi:putative Holliday junction resolvase
MRVAAVDLGKVRVGLAVSDELGAIAHPRSALAGGNQKKLLAELALFAKTEGVRRFLVGLPLNRTGDEGREATRARKFAQALADATGLEVELVDERLSTVEATRRLAEGGVSARKRRPLIDSASAAVLLQAWLDQPRRASDPEAGRRPRPGTNPERGH